MAWRTESFHRSGEAADTAVDGRGSIAIGADPHLDDGRTRPSPGARRTRTAPVRRRARSAGSTSPVVVSPSGQAPTNHPGLRPSACQGRQVTARLDRIVLGNVTLMSSDEAYVQIGHPAGGSASRPDMSSPPNCPKPSSFWPTLSRDDHADRTFGHVRDRLPAVAGIGPFGEGGTGSHRLDGQEPVTLLEYPSPASGKVVDKESGHAVAVGLADSVTPRRPVADHHGGAWGSLGRRTSLGCGDLLGDAVPDWKVWGAPERRLRLPGRRQQRMPRAS